MMKLVREETTQKGQWVDKIYYPKDVEVTIKNPIPDSVLWHQATNWRHAGELFRTNPAAWKKMKAKAQIPIDVIMEVEYAE